MTLFNTFLFSIIATCGGFLGDAIQKKKKTFLYYLYQFGVFFIIFYVLHFFIFNKAEASVYRSIYEPQKNHLVSNGICEWCGKKFAVTACRNPLIVEVEAKFKEKAVLKLLKDIQSISLESGL